MKRHEKQGLLWFSHESVSIPGVRYGFFSTLGGVDADSIHGLTVGGPTSEDVIQKNFTLISRALEVSIPEIHHLTQVHGTEGIWVAGEMAQAEKIEGDALLTQVPGQVLGIKTADCVPIALMADTAQGAAMIHAGWRGMCAGVIEKTVQALKDKTGAAPLSAVIGPCIHQASYEVTQDVVAAFQAENHPVDDYFQRQDGSSQRYLFDLPGMATFLLKKAGVGRTLTIDLDTYAEKTLFYSCRRAAHEGHPDVFGRQLSFIQLEG